MARCGLTEAEIAASPEFDIADRTFAEWKVRHQEFSKALKEGKLLADMAVEDALLKRALGYDYEEIEVLIGSDGETEQVKRLTKHIPGNVTAQNFWLQNRQKDCWRDSRDVFLQGDKDNPIEIISSLT
jgi:hypothetical protein